MKKLDTGQMAGSMDSLPGYYCSGNSTSTNVTDILTNIGASAITA